MNAEYVISS